MATVEELKARLADAEAAQAAEEAAKKTEAVEASGIKGETLTAVISSPRESFIEKLRDVANKLAEEGKLLESEAIGPQEAGVVNPVLVRVLGDIVGNLTKGI